MAPLKLITPVLLGFLVGSCSAPASRAASFPDGTSVQLFYDVSDLPPLATDDEARGIPVRAGPKLSAAQRQRLESNIGFRRIDSDEAFAACFIPHHFFRYLDSSGQVTGTVAVCFCCSGVSISSDVGGRDETETFDTDELAALVRELGVPVNLGCAPGEEVE